MCRQSLRHARPRNLAAFISASTDAFYGLRVLLLGLLWLSACRNPRYGGEALFPPPSIQTDTLYPENPQQVFLTAPDTKNASFTFVGQAVDTLVGRWEAGWATQFALGGTNIRFYAEELVAVDSVVLDIFLASSYGNITVPLQWRVFRLTQPLSASQTYPSQTTYASDGVNLVLPHRDTLAFQSFRVGSYRIPLDTALGRFILTLPTTALTNEQTFQAAFYGLYITAEPFSSGSAGAIYTIFPRSPGTALRIYYREKIRNQVLPQRYEFFISDSCTWAYRLVRTTITPPALRDELQQNPTLWQQKVLVAGGEPVGFSFQLQGWERLARKPILAATLYWDTDSLSEKAYSPFYPRPNSLALYADTTGEVAGASWGLSDFSGMRTFWNLTQPVQEIALGRRRVPERFYVWLPARAYTLQRWVAAASSSSRRPYLVVISASP
ncbi:MAG: DUF4270 domain-containing protein [Bacteroidia bacterium]|nr:DUF4270 domain-containing protein [Bacteroidia bacterium]MDW8236554.1 DUF4270 family protein [Bacteroidia bacterium]